MADLAQNTVQKISQILNRLPKLPAEMTPRNIDFLCSVFTLFGFGDGGLCFHAVCRIYP